MAFLVGRDIEMGLGATGGWNLGGYKSEKEAEVDLIGVLLIETIVFQN
jgi:hypothetical protein